MTRWILTTLLTIAISLSALAASPGALQEDWQTRLRRELPVLGHRNWIVVADLAYPAQTSPGVTTIYTGATQIETVRAVLKMLSGTKHVTPIVYEDAEMRALTDEMAPGISRYRNELKGVIGQRPVQEVMHEELIGKLDEAGKTFRVIILKTDLTVPYTSVFFQLDCAYWGQAKEKQLRDAIRRKTM